MNKVLLQVNVGEYLLEKRSILRIFSIGQIIGEFVYDCDLPDKFGGLDGAVAIDYDQRFVGWELGNSQSVATKLTGCGHC